MQKKKKKKAHTHKGVDIIVYEWRDRTMSGTHHQEMKRAPNLL